MRKPRRWEPGTIYHITTRGNRKEKIFNSFKDYKVYLGILYSTIDYYRDHGYEVICYCLMGNHTHLMIRCNNDHPSYLMRMVNGKYAKYFNKKYNYMGHLFQERYYSVEITGMPQLLETSRYIHLNPVRAELVEYPHEYKWSSYNIFTGEENNEYVNHELILNQFVTEKRYELYKEFISKA